MLLSSSRHIGDNRMVAYALMMLNEDDGSPDARNMKRKHEDEDEADSQPARRLKVEASEVLDSKISSSDAKGSHVTNPSGPKTNEY
jgi:hypothetical protein